MTDRDGGAGPRLGVVDWGIGGIGLVRELDRIAPGLPITYWSDTGFAPYGLVPATVLAARLEAVVAALASRGCTEVVLACNAASTVADRLARPGRCSIPVTGIISHGIAAVPVGLTGTIGVVGGRRTILGGHYRRGLAGPGRRVVSRVAQPLSGHIEAGRTGTAEFVDDLRRIVAPLRGASAVVLACTHYPAAADAFAAALPGTLLVDPIVPVAEAVAARHSSEALGRSAPSGTTATPATADRTYLTTGDPDAMRRAAALAWNVDLPLPTRVDV